jgi:calcineurin-like phosphoesterase family protein
MGKRKTYFISDTHFGHRNIIDFCKRPFSSVGEMNGTLLRNWYETIGDNDRVFFVGDLALGRRGSRTLDWYNKLNGDFIFIKGNHDDCSFISHTSHYILVYGGFKFYFVHNPKDIPKDWKGWAIHGHTHNNDLRRYPFINGERRTINASVEVIGYKPVDLDEIIEMELPTIRRVECYGEPVIRF